MRSLQIFAQFESRVVGRARPPRAVMWAAAWVALAFGVVGARAQPQENALRWAFNTDRHVITFSSPSVSADGLTIFIGAESASGRTGRVLAINSDGSRERWKVDLPQPVDSTPALSSDGSTVYVGCVDGKLYALDATTGVKRWEYDARSFISSSPAVAEDGTIYIGADDARLHAINPDGTARWTFPTGGLIISSPAIGSDGTIYFGSFDRFIYAVSPEGRVKWRYATGAPISSSPAIGRDGTIYIGSDDQFLYALYNDGTLRWRHLVNDRIYSSPVIGADGTVYFGADVHFYALNPLGSDEDRLRWKLPINATLTSTAAVRGDGAVVFGADDGKVRAVNSDGTLRWEFDTQSGDGNLIESSPIVAPDGSIYFGSHDGRLYKLNGNGSPLSVHSPWPAFQRNLARQGRAAPPVGGRLANIATRGRLGGGANLIAGFVTQSASERAYLVRAIGPTLAQLGVSGALADPLLDLYSGQARVTSNDNWDEGTPFFSQAETAAAVGAFPLPAGSKDAALVLPLPPGAFTAHVVSADGGAGVALIEVYDAIAGDSTARLLNLSTRGQVGTGENILIAGVVLGGTGRVRLLLRGIGPGLAQFGVPGVLARPMITVFERRGGGGSSPVLRGTNAGWTSQGLAHDLRVAAASVSAFPLRTDSADAAMLLEAAPGEYTIQISGVGGTTGEAMVELYVLP